ncbi:hypothetical protein ECANGB1_2215 [Enterospora canceri]|uniref:Uncharacterized protein n=1 Tax=Enterospora canceri TaxID=1081671 RepID=A0A1Y1S8P1_9MICR|nr:hypothetical protein ECANGB1_2215 [Enterospora canceri]
MAAESMEKQMDKAVREKDYSKFLAYFGQYCNTGSKNMVFYKTIALLYYLSREMFAQYYALLQTCLSQPNNYAYVVDVYESIRICDLNAIEKLHKDADATYKPLLGKIRENVKKIYDRAVNAKDCKGEASETEQHIVKDIEDCIFVLKNFKK